jgi:hypothetical protein
MRSPPMLAGLFVELCDTTRLVAFVTDQFGTTFFTAASDASVTAQCLSLVVHLPELVASMPGEFRDLAEPVHLPGRVPIPGPDIVLPFQDRSDSLYAVMLRLIVRCAKPPMLSSSNPSTPSSLRLLRRCAIQHSPAGHPYHVGPLILQSKFNSGTSVDFFQREEAERRERDDCDGEASWEKKKRGGGDLPVGQLSGCLVAEGKGDGGEGTASPGYPFGGRGASGEGPTEVEQRKGHASGSGRARAPREAWSTGTGPDSIRDGGMGEWYVGAVAECGRVGEEGGGRGPASGGHANARQSGGGGMEGVDAFVPLLIE